MSLAPNKKGYVACIVYTKTPFSSWQVIDAFSPDKAEALRLCSEAAKAANWKPPRWWQWWRRRDSRAPAAEWDYGL